MSIENGTSSPKHLDKEFFEDALENGLRESKVTTKKIVFSMGSADGENYCSQIYRVVISFTRGNESKLEETSVIIKTMGNDLQGFLEELSVFSKEKLIYLDVIPRMEILLNNVKFAPKCLLALKKPMRTFVFEDMNWTGFRMANREVCLDADHMQLVLKKIGQFHAVSMVFAKKDPSIMSRFHSGLLSPRVAVPTAVFYKIIYKYLEYIIKVVAQWQGFELITEKLRDYYKNFQQRLAACQVPREGEIKVLNHGDLWTNNMMFKYDAENKVEDVVYLDFQLCIYGSPGIDLNYFLYTSAQLDSLKNWEHLLQIYHASLDETLIELRYENRPSLDDIVNEFKQKSCYGFATVIGAMILTTMAKDLSKGNSFESLSESDEKLAPIFAQERLIARLKYSLVELDRLGALDS